MVNTNFLQGDLQALFDALYSVGAIDPVLKMDWSQITNEMMKNQNLLSEAMQSVNSCGRDQSRLVSQLHQLDSKCLNFIAMEVAREFAEFQDREALH